MKKFLIVDGNSILNRAFYGVRPLTTRTGLFTNAVYGMVTILQKHIESLSPDMCAIAFDMRAPTFRHKKYDQYKAQRKGMPEELAVQLPYAKKCVEYMGFRMLEKEGYEADDILGTLSKLADEEGGIQSYILTGDKDSLQLISDQTHVILAKTKEDVIFDKTKFAEEYSQITPDRFIDVKALMGDSSDNIPGVAGIGEKTALKLIADFGSLDAIYADRSAHPVSASVSQKLDDGKDNAYLSRDLATIFREVPLDITLGDTAYNGVMRKELAALFDELEFSALIKRFALDENPLGEAKQMTIDVTDATYDEITDADLLALSGECAVSFDSDDEMLYIFINGNLYSKRVVPGNEALRMFFDANPLITHYYKRLYPSLKKYGYTAKCAFDVMLAAYVLSSNDSNYDLDKLCEKYHVTLASLSSKDGCAAIFALYKIMRGEIEQNSMTHLLYDIEIPLASVLADMEECGFKVDADGLRQYSDNLKSIEDQLAERIYFQAGTEFNINSPKQLGDVLFEQLGLPKGKKTKTGYSTNAEILENLRPHHEIVEDILDYRQVTKLRGTYGEGLLKVIADDGRIHTNFNQTGTATGRLSSTDPNLQNIPVRQELGRELRKYFIAENDDYVLVDADYSQIELRLLAHISGDEVMIEAFREGKDIHTITAAQVFGVHESMVNSDLRKRAKAVNFGIVYGIGDFSLAQDLKITKKQAGDYIRGYLETYRGVDNYLKETVAKATEDGYCTTMFGRRRYIPELKVSNKTTKAFGERVAMNSPIQGTAADIIKIAMINTQKALKESGIDARLILQVHDELIIEANKNCADTASKILKREMESAAALSVPLTADTAFGKTWYDSK
jgi:DNA polymerase I